MNSIAAGPLRDLDVKVMDLVFFGPRIPFCAADAQWGGVTHTFGQMSKHMGTALGLTELWKGALESRALKTPSHQQ